MSKLLFSWSRMNFHTQFLVLLAQVERSPTFLPPHNNTVELQCASHRFDISRLKNIQHQRLFPENSVHVPADHSQNRVVCEIVTVYKSTGFMCETVFMMDFLQQDFISLSRNTLILGWLTNTLLVRTLYKLYIFIIIWATQTTFTVIVFGLYFLSLGPM